MSTSGYGGGGTVTKAAVIATGLAPGDIGAAVAGAAPVRHWCRLYKTASSVIPTTGPAVVTWEGESADTDNYHDLVTNPSRVTIPAGLGGLYVVSCGLDWANNTAGGRSAQLRTNGSGTPYDYFQYQSSPALGEVIPLGVLVVPLAAGDYFEIFGVQASGGNLNVLGAAANGSSYLTASLIAA